MALRLGTIRRIVCASPAYLEARGTPRTPDDLAGHDVIIYEALLAPNAWTFVHDKTDTRSPLTPASSSTVSRRRAMPPVPGSASRARSPTTWHLTSKPEL